MDLRRKVQRWVILIAVLLIILWSAIGTESDPRRLQDIGLTFKFIADKWFPPDWSTLKEAAGLGVLTAQIAIMGTFFAVVVALPLAFLAAWNTAPNLVVYNVMRTILSFIRSVPEIVWGLLFVPTLGLGPFAGVVAIFLHNVGVLGKLLSELVESAEQGQQEAVASTGAGWLLVILYGIIPQIIPNIFSHYFYRLEVGVRTSLILGFIGAGGIGNKLFIDFNLREYAAVSVDVLVIMILVLAVDYFGALIRSRVI
ncbi:phosphonate ABC transporter, permease protein PhnE [Effusibacillus dendaii]|uniref:Phosphonate ABC transporter, permease protein PhnE n=1 Tax=Effusibacillus dendaii TaxID=2743772 RepID=A0A7I8DGJ2_9BACL|nr:phosphonate ABC transporter, permease protein PhnE [Effusibacillus dendaii]BCJ87986.1 phosphonate ABC transporter, permease protein PhnE [Effusibacillus dendaii]